MQSPTSNIVDQAIENLDAEDAKNVDDPKNPKGGSDDKTTPPKDPAKDAGTGKPKPGEDGKPAGDKEPAKPQYDKDGKRIETPPTDEKGQELDKDGKPVEKKKEGEFTADDALEVEEQKAPETPTDNAGIQLSPQESKYIADNIGEPIIIRGVRGEGENAKEVEIKAYSPNDIPADFKFANDQQMMAASNGFRNLEDKAQQLLGNFRTNQSNTAAQDFERRENEGIRQDVADLQKDGRFPKFTVRPGESGFDDSPEAKQMAEVLNIMSERNQNYLKQYEQGRPYKHIGFAEAFAEWESKSPDRQAARKTDEDQAAEDKARKERGTERGDSNRGMNSSNIVKPTVRAGTTTRDILNRIDNEDY
jgi:hypothetical protein